MKTRDLLDLDRGLVVRGGRKICWHRFDFDEVRGVWRYQECSRCGRRKASRMYANLMGPLDWYWLENGRWESPPTIPPAAPWPRPEPPLPAPDYLTRGAPQP